MNKKVNRRNYRWHAFKMKWLVPNYEHAVGPAFWLWKLNYWWKEWCFYNMDPYNACGLLYKIIDWRDKVLLRWLTPQLKNARKFLNFCIEENDTKLLNFTAKSFYVRSRDENQYYFKGHADPLGNVTITKTQWIGKDGKPANLFLTGLFTDDDQKLTENSETIFTGKILTKKQLEDAKAEIVKHEEFCWDHESIALDKLFEVLELKDAEDNWTWRSNLRKAVAKKYFPDFKDNWFELPEEDSEKFEQIIINMTLEEAKELTKKSKEY